MANSANQPTYTSGRGYGGGQGQRGARIDESATLGDIIRQSRSGYRTQSLWQGRSNFLQTSGDEDRSIMPNTTVPRGTGRGGPAAQALTKVGKDYIKNALGVPDIALKDWGGSGPTGYKVRDVISAVKGQGGGFNYSNVVSNMWPVPGMGSQGLPGPVGPAVPGNPLIGPATPSGGGGPSNLPNPTISNPLNNPVVQAGINAAKNAAANANVRGAAVGAVKGGLKGSKFGLGGAVVGATMGGVKGARKGGGGGGGGSSAPPPPNPNLPPI